MRYDLRKPCSNCPFLRKSGVRLRPERAEEIAAYATDSQGAMFPCHKTTVTSDDDDVRRVTTRDSQQCAGSLIFAEKQGCANQAARMAERIGFYDRRKLDAVAFDLVFDDVDEMVKAQDQPKRRK